MKDQKAKPPSTACRYIRNLTLKNVRTFQSEVKLDMCFPNGKLAQWTVILGENGLGKTTLLQYIAGMLPRQDLTAQPVEDKENPGKKRLLYYPFLIQSEEWQRANLSLPHKLPKSLTASVEISNLCTSISDASRNRKNITSDGSKFAGSLGYTFQYEITEDERVMQTLKTWVPDHKDDFSSEFCIFAYGAGRHVAGPASPYLVSESFQRQYTQPGIRTLFNDDLPLISPEQWLLGLHHQSLESSPHGAISKSTLERAKQALCTLLPDVENIIINRIETQEAGMTVLFETPFGAVPFSGLSLGYRVMAAWVIDFFWRMHLRYPHLKEPEKSPAIVLIDEFDLHMHVHWQIEMMNRLSKMFPNTQFIITAHSPLIIQASDGKANIALLKRASNADEKEQVIIENDPKFVRGWRLDQVVTSDLFGLKSSRSKSYANLMKQRISLMQKPSLSKAETAKLNKINSKIERDSPPDAMPAQLWLEQQLKNAVTTRTPKVSNRKVRKHV